MHLSIYSPTLAAIDWYLFSFAIVSYCSSPSLSPTSRHSSDNTPKLHFALVWGLNVLSLACRILQLSLLCHLALGRLHVCFYAPLKMNVVILTQKGLLGQKSTSKCEHPLSSIHCNVQSNRKHPNKIKKTKRINCILFKKSKSKTMTWFAALLLLNCNNK